MAFRVPTLNVSVVDVTCKLSSSITPENFITFIKETSQSSKYKHILGYTEEQLVSSDLIGDKRSSVVDLSSCIFLNDNFVKLVSWYDNECGYSNRMVDFIMHMDTINKLKE